MTFRDVLQVIYIILLRAIGIAVLAFSGLFLLKINSPNHPGMWHWFALTCMVLNLMTAAVYAIPRISPRWLTHPQGLGPGLAVGILHCVTPVIFMVPVMGGVIALGYEEPLSRHLAVGSVSVVWLVVGAAWWLGVILSIWRLDPPAVVPTFTRPPIPREKVDIRALRKSRTV